MVITPFSSFFQTGNQHSCHHYWDMCHDRQPSHSWEGAVSFSPWRLEKIQGNNIYTHYNYEEFGWLTAILFLAPVEGWKGPTGPAGNLWPHLK